MIPVAREVSVDIMDLAVIMDLSEVWYLSQTKTRYMQSQIQNHFIIANSSRIPTISSRICQIF